MKETQIPFINYAYLAGVLEGFIHSLPDNKLPTDPVECRTYLLEELNRMKKSEREFSGVKVD